MAYDEGEGNEKPWERDEWLKEAYETVQLNRNLNPDQTPEELARTILRTNVDRAATTLVRLSQRANSERIRMEASQYIIERVFAMSGEPDAMTRAELVKSVGGVLSAAVKEMGLDTDDPIVRESVRRALYAVADAGAEV